MRLSCRICTKQLTIESILASNCICPDVTSFTVADSSEADVDMVTLENELTESEYIVCAGKKGKNRFIRPCNCSGTIGYAHEQCLLYVINRTNYTKCSICQEQYTVKRKYKPLRKWKCLPAGILLLIILIIAGLIISALIIACLIVNYFPTDPRKNLMSKFGCYIYLFLYGLGVIIFICNYRKKFIINIGINKPYVLNGRFTLTRKEIENHLKFAATTTINTNEIQEHVSQRNSYENIPLNS